MPSGADYWLVNSYGYPSPFGSGKAVIAWNTFLSFAEFKSYDGLKAMWNGGRDGRRIDPHTVESWKATFEEFGLLYVLSGSDCIVITPAGHQLITAGSDGDRLQFGWVGLNALLRYPLRGGRTARSPAYENSDLLLYWFFFAALRELGNHLWWSELERVLSTVFTRARGIEAVELIKQLRGGDVDIESIALPVERTSGAFYNSLNQVVVHASLNHLLLGKANDEAFYRDNPERHHWILQDWLPIVDLALGGIGPDEDCLERRTLLDRLPSPPDLGGDEAGYFDYLGSSVPPIPTQSSSGAQLREIVFEGGTVAVLAEGVNYDTVTPTSIRGPILSLCKLAAGQRVILSGDLLFTYIVVDKQRSSGDAVEVTVRRARPITNPGPIQSLLGGVA
ncbi:MAG: hypothetical protein ACJ757_05170 [Gaiellaceae bacterium]